MNCILLYNIIALCIDCIISYHIVPCRRGPPRARAGPNNNDETPGLHHKIPPHKIFARVWVAQESFVFIGSG